MPGHDEQMSICADKQSTRADIVDLGRYIKPRPARPGFWRSKWNGTMTGTTRSSSGLDDRRKRLLFRCWHRGTREMDLILGRFADAEISAMRDDELAELERLIEVPDPDLYAALIGDTPLDPEYATALFDRIKAFRAVDHDA
jgi:antitoxin CptB